MDRAKVITINTKLKVGAIILAIFFIIYGFLTFRFLSNTYRLALAGKSNLEQAFDLITDQNLIGAKSKVEEAEKNFRAARRNIQSAYLWRPLPWVGRQIKTVNNLLSAGVKVTLAIEDTLDLAQDILKEYLNRQHLSFASLTSQEKGEILEKLSKSQKPLEKIKENLDEAVSIIEAIPDKGIYRPIAAAIKPIKDNLPEFRRLTNGFIPLVTILPELAGYPQPATYLFLLQNNDELRPTGGFIGTYGILKVASGDILQFRTDNTYNLDEPAGKYLKVPAPPPLKKYLKADYWYLRDSNWSPDFAISARLAEWFYLQEGGPEQNLSGVIAITPVFISSVLKVIGNQEVDGILFTPENLSDRLEERVGRQYYELGIPEQERKAVVGNLGLKIREEIFKLPINRLGQIVSATLKALDEKHFLVFSKSPEVQQLVETRNWAGRVHKTSDDFLLVVDSNLASLKTDQVIDRDINYQVRSEGEDLIAKVSINYSNRGNFTWKTTRLRTYTRVYVPKGSQLISASGLMDDDRSTKPGQVEVGEEFDRTYFAGFIAIEPKEKGTLSFEYKLPKKIKARLKTDGYKLLVQKQPGTLEPPLQVRLDFPHRIKTYQPTGFDTRREGANTVIFNTNLLMDREFRVEF